MLLFSVGAIILRLLLSRSWWWCARMSSSLQEHTSFCCGKQSDNRDLDSLQAMLVLRWLRDLAGDSVTAVVIWEFAFILCSVILQMWIVMTDDDFKVPLSVLNLLKQKECSRFLWVDYSEGRSVSRVWIWLPVDLRPSVSVQTLRCECCEGCTLAPLFVILFGSL